VKRLEKGQRFDIVARVQGTQVVLWSVFAADRDDALDIAYRVIPESAGRLSAEPADR
jgi:uncharacterized protein YcgI (DUF1989 family)